MANKSITFRPPLKNFHLSGEAPNRNTYSSVNHDIHTASIIAKSGLSICAPLASVCWKCGTVANVKAIVDRTMKSIDITAIICKYFYQEKMANKSRSIYVLFFTFSLYSNQSNTQSVCFLLFLIYILHNLFTRIASSYGTLAAKTNAS